jgi:Divergent InlB B-repeat domain
MTVPASPQQQRCRRGETTALRGEKQSAWAPCWSLPCSPSGETVERGDELSRDCCSYGRIVIHVTCPMGRLRRQPGTSEGALIVRTARKANKSFVRRPRSLVGLAGMVAVVMCLVWPAAAQAAVDPCVVGTWEAPMPNGDYAGTLTVNIPSPSAGSATFRWHGEAFDGSNETVPAPTVAGVADVTYTLDTPSTPDEPNGSATFDSVLTTMAQGTAVSPGVTPAFDVEATFGSPYSCTASSLVLDVTFSDVTPGHLSYSFSADTFTRTTPGPGVTDLQVVMQGTAAGTGHVVSGPPGIACPGTCSASYWQGTPVQLVATLTPTRFLGWSGPCVPVVPMTLANAGSVRGQGRCNLTAGGTVSATYGHAVGVTITGAGKVVGTTTSPRLSDGFLTPPTIDCPDTCLAAYAQPVTLTATPKHGYELTGWTGPCVRRTPDTCALDLSEPSFVTAIFSALDRSSL